MKSLVSKVKSTKEVKKKETPKVVPAETSDLEKSLVDSIDKMLDGANGISWKQSDTFAPSGYNQCPRYAMYRFRGYEQKSDFSAQTRRIFDLGNRIEDAVGELFTNMGILIDSQVEVINEEPPIRGFVDFVIDWDGPKPVECKSINEAGFAYRQMYHKPTDEHFRQLQCYLKIMDHDSGFLFYYSKNNSAILPILVQRDDEFIEKLFAKYGKIWDAYKNDQFSERPYKKTSGNCKKCDAFDWCWEKDTEVGVKINLK